MMGTSSSQRLRLQAVAAEFVEQMGVRIRARREELGLTRPDVARRMPGKVGENQIYRWETGKHQPKADTLEALAAALETEPSAFMAPVSVKDETPDLFVRDAEPSDDLSSDLAATTAAIRSLENQVRLLRTELAARDAEVLRQLAALRPPSQGSQPGQQP